MTSHRTPHATALADQLTAAEADARRLFAALADQIGGTPTWTPPSPAVETVFARLNYHLATSRVTMCRHLRPAAPAPAWWPIWAPGRLRCAGCVARASLRIRGTREDKICDACRHFSPSGLYNSATLLPACFADLPGFVGVWPPVTVLFGVCAACRNAQPHQAAS